MLRIAEKEDIDRLLEIYFAARKFMHENGNPTQWGSNYPDEEILQKDIEKKHLFVIKKEDTDTICGCFALIGGNDPTYDVIEGGQWMSDSPYGTIHRMASDGSGKGLFEKCVQFARTKYDHLRVDTHENNKTMQHVILKNSFEYRGIIYLSDGSPRKAYEWISC